MKKSVEILGLPIISITEGRELGVSKTLVIDAKNGAVAAITIEDDDWYRGVKLIPYEAIIAIGEDAVTITNSENILNLDEAGDYERLLVENIRVIGTKAITKSGYIEGKVTEVFVGAGGKIEKCEITTPAESIEEVTADQISIFGKQVTVIDVDREKKNNLNEQPAFEPVFEAFSQENESQTWTPPLETSDANTFSATEEFQSIPELTLPPKEEPETTEETQAELEQVMTPDPVEQPAEEPVEETPAEQPVEETPAEQPVEETPAEQPVEETPAEQPVEEEKISEEDKKIAAMTQQAEDLKAALQKARKNQHTPPEQKPMLSQKKQVEKAVDERRRRVLLGKHATKTITAESGTVVVEAGAEVTEEVLQRARLSNKFIELSMNVQ
ncbi:MAG: PRC-barrel domain-containing protein [Selenomonadaceae bacterium]|nr:PRC-barrel domain-containing protein [Selenomonadaceae bacterium]